MKSKLAVASFVLAIIILINYLILPRFEFINDNVHMFIFWYLTPFLSIITLITSIFAIGHIKDKKIDKMQQISIISLCISVIILILILFALIGMFFVRF